MVVNHFILYGLSLNALSSFDCACHVIDGVVFGDLYKPHPDDLALGAF